MRNTFEDYTMTLPLARPTLAQTGRPADPSGILSNLLVAGMSFQNSPVSDAFGSAELAREEAALQALALAKGYARRYRPDASGNIDPAMPSPTIDMVAALINKMKCCCGFKGQATKPPGGPAGLGQQLSDRSQQLFEGSRGLSPPPQQ